MNRLIIVLLCGWLLPKTGWGQLHNTGAYIVMDGAYLVADDLDFDNNGVFTQTAGTVKFSGSSNTSISGNTGPQFFALELNKSGAALRLQNNISINNQLLFTNGLLNLNNYTITLDAAAALNGENENSRITGTTGGYVQITRWLNAPVAANPGNLGVIITSAANLGNTVIRRGHVSQTNGYGLGNSIFRYYDILPASNTALNATLSINYFDAELNGLDESALTVWKSANTSLWSSLGYDTRNTTINAVEKTGITDMARFTLSSPNNALPLVWSSFNTSCLDYGLVISWKTQSESNTRIFKIRRSSDGVSWQTIGAIPAAGNSNQLLAYTYTDRQSFAGAYYQILQEDMDGRQTVSPLLRSSCSVAETIKVYPTPTHDNCWVSIQTAGNTMVVMNLYDHKGALVKQLSANVTAGINQIDLPMNNLPQGMYSLVVQWGKGLIKTVKIVKL